MSIAEQGGDEPDQKRVATRRLGDPVPGAPAPKGKHRNHRKSKKARR